MKGSMEHYPPPLMTSDPGSYARYTILERKPQIIHQVMVDNPYPLEIVSALEKFRDEIANSNISPLREDQADVEFWNIELEKYAGKTWLDIPWFFAETFFYRRLCEAVQYFQPGEWHLKNPFQAKKDQQIFADINRLSYEWEKIYQLSEEQTFTTLLHSALWGNRADLSNFNVLEQARSGSDAFDEQDFIIIDHTTKVLDTLCSKVKRVDFFNDNVGSDILFDLALSDFLLSRGWSENVVFHLKNQPYFVSDAMPGDIHQIVECLIGQNKPQQQTTDLPQTYNEGVELGKRLEKHLKSGRLSLNDDPFWSSCLMFRQFPIHLLNQLGESDFIIIKGDVNYRRLLDDLHWPFTIRLEDVTTFFPARFVTLRTLKGEILVGLAPGEAEAIQKLDPNWLINGKRGLIQTVF